MKHLIMGTAGHIDHGKTVLVRALTGIDTDTLDEEKRRGISINLGYAYFDLPGGTRIGVVDVPGHMRFIRTMLAGAAGIDFVLFVVAADDSVMPQTREHLDILRFLGVRTGIIVITKIDLVDADMADLVEEEVRELTADGFLAGAPVIRVSSITGQGVPELKAAVETMTQGLSERRGMGIFRMPVDRAFTVQGFGTVVTGTVFSGSIEKGAAVVLLPSEKESEIRGIEVHKVKAARAFMGQRTALNLAGLSKEAVGRGDVVCTPGFFLASRMLDCRFELLPGVRPLKQGEHVKFYLGTTEAGGRLYRLGKEDLVQIRLDTPVVAVKDDRFVVRDQGLKRTLGGGVIVDVHPLKHKRQKNVNAGEIAGLAGADTRELVLNETRKTRSVLSADELCAKLTLKKKSVHAAIEALAAENKVVAVPLGRETGCINQERFESLVSALRPFVSAVHCEHPLIPVGPGKQEIQNQCKAYFGRKVPDTVFAGLWKALCAGPVFKEVQRTLALGSWEVVDSAEIQKLKARIYNVFDKAGFSPPEKSAAARTKPEIQALDALLKEKKLVSIENLIFSVETLERGKALLSGYIKKQGPGTVSDLRKVLNTSRKFAIPLLNFYEAGHFLVRNGDLRELA
jgi:selenocysteine-specific elongation factor